MKSIALSFAAFALVALVAPAQADTRVIASPGVTLTEAAQAKFNRGARQDDRHVAPTPGTSEPSRQFYASAGLTIGDGRAMTLDQVFVAKINREVGRDQQQLASGGEPVAMGTRAYGQGVDRTQLIASARIDPDEGATMSLQEIAAAKFAAESGDD